MLRIVSGWTNAGGSTTAFINLTNLFNRNGIETIFYGPNLWHLDKCKSGHIKDFKSDPNDSIIAHFLNTQIKPPCKKMVLSSHEHEVFPIANINYMLYDKIHYVSEHQRRWHNINHPSVVIPNVLDDLKPNKKPNRKIGGIIGSIDPNKQTHISILKALEDGCEEVYLFGNSTNPLYFSTSIAPLFNGSVILKGYCNNKQYMYDSITDVYHYSKMETWGYIYAEAKLTNTTFHGSGSIKDIEIWDNDKILDAWLKIIN